MFAPAFFAIRGCAVMAVPSVDCTGKKTGFSVPGRRVALAPDDLDVLLLDVVRPAGVDAAPRGDGHNVLLLNQLLDGGQATSLGSFPSSRTMILTS